LPLEELELTPQWVKSTGNSYANHSGGDREPRREGRRPDRDRGRPAIVTSGRVHRGRRSRATVVDRVPNSAVAGRRMRRDAERRPAPSAPPTLPIEVTFQPEDKGFAR
jgi:hypothetical protein